MDRSPTTSAVQPAPTHRGLLTLGVLAALAVMAAIALPLPATATPAGAPVLTVKGIAGNGFVPRKQLKLSIAQLAALPQATVTAKIDGVKMVEKGPQVAVLLDKMQLVGVAGCDPDNESPRYWVQATSKNGAAALLAALELDPEGAGKLAILAINENGKQLARPRLVVRGDRSDARDLPDVFALTVGRATPQLYSENEACNPPPFKPTLPTVPDAGGVIVNGAVAHPTTLTWEQLQALPQITQNDTYESHGRPKTRQEIGPSLYSILAAADPQFGKGPKDSLRYYVELTSSADGAPVIVSWAEVDPAVGGKQLLLSLSEDGQSLLDVDPGPRLTVPGDKSGERYNYGVQVVTVLRAPAFTG